MKSLLANLVRLSGMQFVLAVAGIARFKALALELGANGFGEFQQIALAVGTVATVCSFGLSVGLNRNIAATEDPKARQHLLANANGMVWSLSLFSVAGLTLLLWLSPTSLSGIGVHARPVVVATFGILLLWVPLEASKNNLIAFLLGALDVKGMTTARSLAVFVGTAVSIPLVWRFGIVGAALQLVFITTVLLGVLARRCQQLGYQPFARNLSRTTVYLLATFGAAALASNFAKEASDVWVRAALIKHFGAAANGYYQAAISLADQAQAILVGAISSYALAKLSQQPDRDSTGATVDLLLTALVPITTLAFGLMGLLCLPLLVVLYSSEFARAAPFFPLLLASFLIRVFVWVIAAPLLSMGRIAIWLGLDLTLWTVRYIASLLLLQRFGPQALVAGFMVGMCVHFALNMYVYIRVLRLPIDMSHVRGLAIGIAVVLTTTWLGSHAEVGTWSRLAIGGAVWLTYLAATLHTRVGFAQLRKFLQRNRPATSL
jgi:O-antigen/teichoic acid export membrane protein